MTKEFLAKVEKLLRWIEFSEAEINRNPRVFADLDLSGLKSGHVLLQGHVLPAVNLKLELPIVAVIFGGTNTGKSTLANSIAGFKVSPSGGTASFTKRLVALGRIEDLNNLVKAKPEWKLQPLSELSNPGQEGKILFIEGLSEWPDSFPILIDTPDLDSSDQTCRTHSVSALELSDLIVWVTTQQKYKDLSGMRFLSQAMLLVPVRFDVFNQALPRHDKALEDMRAFYDSSWPENERYTFSICEQPGPDDKLLQKEYLESLKEKLASIAAQPKIYKSRVIGHGFQFAGNHFIESATKYVRRQRDCGHLMQLVRDRFDEVLFRQLRSLPGHSAPFELQTALIRVLEPRLQTRMKTFLNRQVRNASQTVGWAFGKVRKLIDNNANVNRRDPIAARDKDDLERTKTILEIAREDVIDFSRTWALSGHPLHIRFNEEVKNLAFPAFENLEKSLSEHLEKGNREKILPLLSHFEHDLKRFCDQNPTTLSALKVAVPGFSALAAIAAAAFSIHSFTILPGVSEYFLGGIAIPIYQRLDDLLPGNLLNLLSILANEPIIARAREDFAKMRRAIFFEAAGWLSKPIEELLLLSNKRDFNPVITMKDLQQAWGPLAVSLVSAQ